MNDYFIYFIGLIAQFLFSLRLIIQWLFSEKENKVVTPTFFLDSKFNSIFPLFYVRLP